jgi:catechol 2,3-dioxygenase-like lactoylglutathione lyase family enzyme
MLDSEDDMIIGAHAIIYSKDAEADRAFFRNVLEFDSVDAGGGWLIFGLPPAEVAVHPADSNGRHELYLMCDDVSATVHSLQAKGIACQPVTDEGWGLLTSLTLPGGGAVGLYQPRHPTAFAAQPR